MIYFKPDFVSSSVEEEYLCELVKLSDEHDTTFFSSGLKILKYSKHEILVLLVIPSEIRRPLAGRILYREKAAETFEEVTVEIVSKDHDLSVLWQFHEESLFIRILKCEVLVMRPLVLKEVFNLTLEHQINRLVLIELLEHPKERSEHVSFIDVLVEVLELNQYLLKGAHDQ